MTAVDASPDLRHARVYVSVLGDEEDREQSLDGLRSSHGYLQAGIAKELRIKHTPTLEFVHDESIDHGFRISELLDEREASARERHDRDRSGDRGAARCGEAAAHHPREPGWRRSGVAHRDALDPPADRQGLADVHVAGGVPAVARVPAHDPRRACSAPRRRTSTSARWSSWTAATSTACRWTSSSATASTSSTSTTTTTTPASAR